MSMRRITITIPPEILEAAEAEAAREGISVSAWLSQAAAHAAKIAEGLATAREVLAEIGGADPKAEAEFDAAFDRLRAPETTGQQPASTSAA